MSSCGIICRAPFIARGCVSNWSMHGSAGKNGPEMELEWVLVGLEKGLQRWLDDLV